MKHNLQKALKGVQEAGLYPEFHVIDKGVNEPSCRINGRDYLLFCANNYLGMTNNPKIVKAATEAIKKYGVGPGGSRVISGNVDIIVELERKISELTGTEDCVSFPTGYMANVGIFSAIMDPVLGDVTGEGDAQSVIYSDENNHGSIVDGCRLSTAKKVIFKHNDINDLRKKMKEYDYPKKLIVTEGVFSLEGEILDLPKFIEVAKESNSFLMVDDAHGVGILGEKGGGVGELYKCANEIDILMGCMDKAFGGTGGYLCGKKELIKYLRISTRPSLLSSALPTGMAGAMIESVKLISSGKRLRTELFRKAALAREQLVDAGFNILGRDVIPAIALYIGEDKKGVAFEKSLFEKGIYCPIIRYPAVPYGQSRFRIIVMVTHTDDQLKKLISSLIKTGRELAIIK